MACELTQIYYYNLAVNLFYHLFYDYLVFFVDNFVDADDAVLEHGVEHKLVLVVD